MYRQEIEAYFEERRDQIVSQIARLIPFRSVREAPQPGAPYGVPCREVLAEAAAMARELGFEPKNFENHVITVELNDKPAKLGLFAHLDVVEEGRGWTRPPYELTREEGLIFGRGTADNKGPAVVSLYALKAARDLAGDLACGVRLVLGAAEETGSDDLKYYFKQEAPPPMSFSPDAFYPVLNVEKGQYWPVFAAQWPVCAQLPRVVRAVGGATSNIMPRDAYALVEGMTEQEVRAACDAHPQQGVAFTVSQEGKLVRIDALGTAAHASKPELGANAQTALCALLAALPLAPHPSHEALRRLAQLFPHGDHYGNGLGVAMRDEVSGPLTLVFSVLDFQEHGVTAQFDSRVSICGTKENVQDVAERALQDAGFEIVRGSLRAGHYTPEDTPLVQTLNRVYEAYTGLPGGCVAIGGGSYLHDVDGGVVFGCSFPGTENRMHGADEFAVVDELIASAKMFTQIILDLCK